MTTARPTLPSDELSLEASSSNALSRPLVLGIESSCDDTACAVLDGEGRVLSSVVSSQLAAHLEYGGVVPEIASREHLRNWPAVRAQALSLAGVALAEIDVVAATRGPGLVGSLLVGLSVGKAIAYGLGKPFFGVHHLEGHLYSPFLVPAPSTSPSAAPASASARAALPDPAHAVPERFIGLVVSGGHTALYSVLSPKAGASAVDTLCETRDDAMGECFDKVGKRLGLPFPGGPVVDRLAELGEHKRGHAPLPARPKAPEPRTLFFRTSRCGDTLDFSYSGLKTQAIVEVERLEREGFVVDPGELMRLSGLEPSALAQSDARASSQFAAIQLLAAFRDAAVRQVIDRLDRYRRSVACSRPADPGPTGPSPTDPSRPKARLAHAPRTPQPIRELGVSGGVAANRALRRALVQWGERERIQVHLVALAFCGDNAAMIAHAALRRHHQGETGDPLATDAKSRLRVG